MVIVIVFLLFDTKVGNPQIISNRRLPVKPGVKEAIYWRYINMAAHGSEPLKSKIEQPFATAIS